MNTLSKEDVNCTEPVIALESSTTTEPNLNGTILSFLNNLRTTQLTQYTQAVLRLQGIWPGLPQAGSQLLDPGNRSPQRLNECERRLLKTVE